MFLYNYVKRDTAYLLVVSSAIIVGSCTRRIHNANRKKSVSTIIGLLISFLFCGFEMLHSLVSIGVSAILIKGLKIRMMPRIVFAFVFAYRIFFSLLCHHEVWRNESTLANGVQLIATIKLISVAYEIGEYRKHQSLHSNGHVNGGVAVNDVSNHKALSLLKEPSLLDIICYMYCFFGICTGPFYRYRTYHDWLCIPKHASSSIPALNMVVSRLPIFVILIILSTVVGSYFPTDYMKSDEFYDAQSSLYRFCYVIPIGAVGMARYGVVWFLSEFSFIVGGLGVYPESKQSRPGRGPSVFSENDKIWSIKGSPKPVIYNFEAVRNIYIKEGFTSETYGKTFRYWNCTVQWWLAHFIYASALLSGKPALIKWIAVGLFSALWHGFRAGYYFAFVGMVYISFAEKLLLSQVTSKLSSTPKIIFSMFHYFLFKMIGIGSFMATFSLSSYADILRYLSSVYFGVYSVATLSILLSLLLSMASKLTDNPGARIKSE